MKNSLKTLLLASVATASSAFAATTTTDPFDIGDIMLGFTASSGTGAGQNLMVNLGSYQQFDNNDGATINFTSGIIADLNATFGDGSGSNTDWRTSGLVKWSLIGTTSATLALDGINRKTIFTTVASGATAPASASDSSQGGDTTDVTSMTTLYNGSTTTANSSVSVVVANSNSNSMQGRLTTSPTVRFGTTNQIVASDVGSVLDFYAVVPTGSVPSGLAIDGDGVVFASGPNLLGTISLNSSGVSFTATGTPSVVPEPSTYAALAGAAVLGLAAYRRRPAARV